MSAAIGVGTLASVLSEARAYVLTTEDVDWLACELESGVVVVVVPPSPARLAGDCDA